MLSATVPPVVEQWYRHLDKGQEFHVTAFDDDAGTVEIQNFDGDVEELEIEDWYALKLEPIEPPEDWTGPVDTLETDDLGYTETDMSAEDWAEALKESPAEHGGRIEEEEQEQGKEREEA